MIARIGTRLRKPALVLAASFLVGAMIDAIAERVTAAPAPLQQDSTIQPADENPNGQQEPEQDTTPENEYLPLERPSQFEDDLPLMGMDDIYRPLSEISVDIREKTDVRPPDLSYQLYRDGFSTNYPNTFQQRLAAWDAPNIRYQPLYFEYVGLERYGYTCRPLIQPFVSASHLAASLAMLPYNMIHDCPTKCRYPLGYCRPGSPAPQVHTRWLWKSHLPKQ